MQIYGIDLGINKFDVSFSHFDAQGTPAVRALCLPKLIQYLLPRYLSIALRGGHTGMAEHGADTLERRTALQHEGGRTVAICR
ncbi:hypothetical protein [Prevotellamassilia timonensis]|uniref:hypothetical protein n=1 Tax=Prevotellamassilia timonensis TaxID=1852370 RepID=UPI00402639FC